MIKQKLFTCIFLIFPLLVFSQLKPKIIAGPMLGHTEFRTAQVWVEFSTEITKATLNYLNINNQQSKGTLTLKLTATEFNVAKFTITALEPGTTYSYTINVNGTSKVIANGTFTTQTLWQHRQPAPNFSFITGSCAYFNETKYDRPGKPYGAASSIFEQMAKENTAFMLWLGDNWYTREVDYFSKWGLNYRASKDRSTPELQNLLNKMPQYAIWDDHDYGPNDADKSYILKDESRNVFKKYWANPSYGLDSNGIYTKLTWNDADIFMLDDRWFRDNDYLPDSVNNDPNKDKLMFGKQQMAWLKNSLMLSNRNKLINFRIIASGSQILNKNSPFDGLKHYPTEYVELLEFIGSNNIQGIIFLTGDKHHSEILKLERPGKYSLYDITVSPLNAGIAKTSGSEANNPMRVGKEIAIQNYGRFNFAGKAQDRTLTVDFLGENGQIIDTWSVKKTALQ